MYLKGIFVRRILHEAYNNIKCNLKDLAKNGNLQRETGFELEYSSYEYKRYI